MNKHGWENMITSTVFEFQTLEERMEFAVQFSEVHDIANNALWFNKKGETGDNGGCHSEETCKKMSDSAKGKILKQTTKDKISKANKGKIVSIETRNKQSLSLKGKNKGKPAPFKGRHHTEETKKYLSEIGKKRIISEKSRRKQAESLKGHKHSEETKLKIGLKHKGKIVSEETKEKLRNTFANGNGNFKGKHHTQERNKIVSEKLKGRKQEILTCPFCSKTGGNTMKRWHFERCKFKQTNDLDSLL